jgi:large subunit ribosomal protein L6
MSRVAKMPVAIPQGVDVSINASQISVKGAGGSLSVAAHALVKVENNAGQVTFIPVDESR